MELSKSPGRSTVFCIVTLTEQRPSTAPTESEEAVDTSKVLGPVDPPDQPQGIPQSPAPTISPIDRRTSEVIEDKQDSDDDERQRDDVTTKAHFRESKERLSIGLDEDVGPGSTSKQYFDNFPSKESIGKSIDPLAVLARGNGERSSHYSSEYDQSEEGEVEAPDTKARVPLLLESPAPNYKRPNPFESEGKDDTNNVHHEGRARVVMNALKKINDHNRSLLYTGTTSLVLQEEKGQNLPRSSRASLEEGGSSVGDEDEDEDEEVFEENTVAVAHSALDDSAPNDDLKKNHSKDDDGPNKARESTRAATYAVVKEDANSDDGGNDNGSETAQEHLAAAGYLELDEDVNSEVRGDNDGPEETHKNAPAATYSVLAEDASSEDWEADDGSETAGENVLREPNPAPDDDDDEARVGLLSEPQEPTPQEESSEAPEGLEVPDEQKSWWPSWADNLATWKDVETKLARKQGSSTPEHTSSSQNE